MRKMFLLSVIFLTFILSGCDPNLHRRDPEIVYKTKTVLITPEDALLKNCSVPKPIVKKEYLNLSLNDKESYLSGLTVELYSKIDECNADKKSLRDWKSRQIDLYKDK